MTDHCPIHGAYESEEFYAMGARFTTSCPLCEQADEIREAESKKAEALADRIKRLESMNMEPAYIDATLESFKADTPELERAVSRTKDLIEGRIKKLVFVGRNGTGKTHLACAALHILGGRIMTMYEISTTIRASYTSRATQTELEIVDGYARLPLFVIDEIGRTKGGDVEANWLSYIIDKRHTRSIPLILISNKHVKKDCPAGGCADCLENYIGEDIMSRLNQDGALIRFTGADYRRGK
jgi:DNA replication protein DnaC